MRVLLASLAALTIFVAVPASASARSLRRGAARKAEPVAQPGTRVAVQPITGAIGPSLRGQLARLLQQRGFRVLTSLPSASGTAQYPGMARENRLAAFLVTDVTEHGRSATITFLVWRGEDGGVAGRWSVWAPEKRLWKTVTKGFWKNLGRALAETRNPPSDEPESVPILRINAGDPLDEPIVSGDGFSRRAPILR